MGLLSVSFVVSTPGLPRPKDPIVTGSLLALLAALTFGVTTPIIQEFGHGAGVFPIAALLYAGAAVASFARRPNGAREAPVRAVHLPRLLVVALLGAVLAPVGLVWGLQHTSASAASLLLNFEGVFTVLLAWRCHREPIGRRVVLAVALICAGGACLVVGSANSRFGWGAVAVVFATFAWALDNTLTRPLADLDPTQVVRWKGAVGASLGFIVSVLLKQTFPKPIATLGLLACGATGYGLSLRLYLLAQRRIGAGRTGSIFALAPFVGAAAAWSMGERAATVPTLAAALLFGVGIYLHLTEVHRHQHSHDPIEHEHAHRHDDGHHDHLHESPIDGEHCHSHRHDDRIHNRPHGPDAHHDHGHA